MKTAELWNGDNLSQLQHLSAKRTLLVEAQVGSRFVVVAEVRRQGSVEMASVQDDVVVQTLPSNRADESLGVWILRVSPERRLPDGPTADFAISRV
jgi:hypothetical protein